MLCIVIDFSPPWRLVQAETPQALPRDKSELEIMETAMNLTDRRGVVDRRSARLGPPEGMLERRLNMERRIFDYGTFSMNPHFPVTASAHAVRREGLSAIPEIAEMTL